MTRRSGLPEGVLQLFLCLFPAGLLSIPSPVEVSLGLVDLFDDTCVDIFSLMKLGLGRGDCLFAMLPFSLLRGLFFAPLSLPSRFLLLVSQRGFAIGGTVG